MQTSFSSSLPPPKYPPITGGVSNSSQNELIIRSDQTIIPKQDTKSVLPISYNEEGQIDYGKIIASGHSSSRNIQSSLKDTIPLNQKMNLKGIRFSRPGPEEVKECVERTRLALQKIVDSKIQSSNIVSVPQNRNEPTYVKYTTNSVLQDDTKPKQRIIKIVDVQQDPTLPPKHKLRKNRGGPPSPPPPILRSPPRTATKEEQEAWKIPTAISSWKNPLGHTITLEQRVANNKRVTDTEINPRFAEFAEALDANEKAQREEMKLKQAMRIKLAEQEQKEKDERLRILAENARRERYGNESNKRPRRD